MARYRSLIVLGSLLLSGPAAMATRYTGTVFISGHADTPFHGPEWTWRIDFLSSQNWTESGTFQFFSGFTPFGGVTTGIYEPIDTCLNPFFQQDNCVYGLQADFPAAYGTSWPIDFAAVTVKDGRLESVGIACGNCSWNWSREFEASRRFDLQYDGVSGPVTNAVLLVTPEPATLLLCAIAAVCLPSFRLRRLQAHIFLMSGRRRLRW
jgi:hypothetical protein